MKRLAAGLVVWLLAAACGSPASDTPATSSPAVETTIEEHDEHAHQQGDEEAAPDHDDHEGEAEVPADAEEVPDPMPRLVAADTDGSAVVVDLVSGETLTTLSTASDTLLLAPVDGRMVLAGHHEADAVTVIDGGSWSEPHGDHFHHFVSEAEVVGRVDGSRPAHLVTHQDRVAMFFDGLGEASIFEVADLHAGDLHTDEVVSTAQPHHGLVIPLDDHFLVSIPADDPEALPIGVELRHGTDEVEASFPDCPDLHGELATHEVIALACADGVMILEDGAGGWAQTLAPYPEDVDGRVWSLAGSHDLEWATGIVSQSGPPYTSQAEVVVVDLAGQSTVSLAVSGAGVAVAADPAREALVVLTSDGGVDHVEAATGRVLASAEVLDAIDLGSDGPMPALVVSGDRAYVSDPPSSSVVELALNDSLRIARRLELPLVPVDLSLVGG